MTADNGESSGGPGDRRGAWSAILFADMVDYSRMMGRDELGTLEFMVDCSRMIEELGQRYGGDLVQTTGDGFLLLFDTVAGAVKFGHELHQLVAKRQANTPEPARFRVGIHSGEVYRSTGMIHGHAVNIAARLEAEASPGACVISQTVLDGLRADLRGAFNSIGAPPLKNIAERIHLYQTTADVTEAVTSQTAFPEICVLGGLSLCFSTKELSFAPHQKTSELFGYLALLSGQRERNDKIANVLWPDQTEGAARRTFANCRRRLKAILDKGFPGLIYGVNGHTGLNEIHFDIDLNNIRAGIRKGRVARILVEQADWPDMILDGFDTKNPVLGAWLKVTRTTWRDRIVRELTSLLERCELEDDACIDSARAILALEPGNEVASSALIEHLGSKGNRSAALGEYKRLSSYLMEVHELVPSERVEAARRSLADEKVQRPAIIAETANPVPHRLLRLAIEPFASPEDANPYLADRFRSELVSNLARFREWSVVEDSGLITDTTNPTSARPVCAYAIGGNLDAKDQLNLTLRDLTHGRIIWTTDIELESGNWIASQRETIGRIAAHLETYISADRLANVIGVEEHQVTSHDRWLEAEQIFAKWEPEAAEKADRILRDIVRQDPSFAPAFSSLASYYNVRHVIQPGTPHNEEDAKEAFDLAQRAVELDPLDARNHLAVAWTAALTGAFDRATIHLDMAASLNPNGLTTLISCAMGYAFCGQADRGEQLIDHVERIAPMLSDYQWCYVASVHFLAERYEDALKAAQMSGDRIVDNQGWIAASLAQLGRKDEASRAYDRLIDGVHPVWAGDGNPTAEAVFDWFTNAYPLRNSADQERLRASLEEALRGQ